MNKRGVLIAISILALVFVFVHLLGLSRANHSKMQVESVTPTIYSGVVVSSMENLGMPYNYSGLRLAKVVKKEKGVSDETYTLIMKDGVSLKVGDRVYFALAWVSEKTFDRGGPIPVRVGLYIPPEDMPDIW